MGDKGGNKDKDWKQKAIKQAKDLNEKKAGKIRLPGLPPKSHSRIR